MPEPESPESFRVAAGWVEKADNDLKNASHTLELEEDCPTGEPQRGSITKPRVSVA